MYYTKIFSGYYLKKESISTTLMIYTSWFYSLLCATQHEAQNAKFYIKYFLLGYIVRTRKIERFPEARMESKADEKRWECSKHMKKTTVRIEAAAVEKKSDSLMHRDKTWLQNANNKRTWHTNLYRAMLPQSTETLRTQKTWGCGFVLMKLYSLRTRIWRFYIRY